MAALSATVVGHRLPLGDRVVKTLSVAAIGTAAADEYITTGLSWIDTVVGYTVYGTAGEVITAHTGTVGVGANFVLNAAGTGQTAGTTPGALGIEIADAAANSLHVTVIGKV